MRSRRIRFLLVLRMEYGNPSVTPDGVTAPFTQGSLGRIEFGGTDPSAALLCSALRMTVEMGRLVLLHVILSMVLRAANLK